MNILVAPNSFKECADSVEIAEIINSLIVKNTLHKVVSRPISDGGDGFLSVIKNILNVVQTEISIKDQNNKVKNYKILIDKKTETAYLESASVIGLKCIEKNPRTPLSLNSDIIGKIISQLSIKLNQAKLNVKNLVVGIGGTATIDFGIGTCSQLGLSLFDKEGNQLTPVPQNFDSVASFKFLKPDLPFNLKCIVDVETELIGEPGAIEIYGKQKGASENDLKIIKNGIINILDLISADKNFIVPKKLNGAGGGLAAGLNIFLGAEIILSLDFIKDDILKDINLNEIDAVITGEGSFDYQSFEGKGSGIILKLFAKKNIPIFLINGSTNLPENYELSENVFVINLIDFFESKEESVRNYQEGITNATQIVLNHLNK
jgi:glycerate kinase